MRRALISSLAGLLVLAWPSAGQNDPVKEEIQKLHGRWAQLSVEGDGKTLEIAKNAPDLIIDADNWLELSAAGDSISTFKINPKKEPKQIDRMPMGSVSVSAVPGIYKLENDTLTLAVPVPFGGKLQLKRPTRFTTQPGDWFAVIVYKRVTDEHLAEILQPLRWQSDWKDAFHAAKDQDRLVFVDYFATWCKPCQLMDATVFQLPDVKRRLSEFVLLRIDVDRSKIAWSNNVHAFPTYAIYDPGERERFRIIGARPAGLFRRVVDDIQNAAPALLKASDFFEAKKDLEAEFLVGNTYSRLGMGDQAREAYKEARKTAEQHGEKGTAQLADALSAFTFARQGNPSHAIKLLKKLSENPADRDTGALIWLTLGNAYRLTQEPKAAIDAYQRAQSLAHPDSKTYKDAAEAIAKLQ